MDFTLHERAHSIQSGCESCIYGRVMHASPFPIPQQLYTKYLQPGHCERVMIESAGEKLIRSAELMQPCVVLVSYVKRCFTPL